MKVEYDTAFRRPERRENSEPPLSEKEWCFYCKERISHEDFGLKFSEMKGEEFFCDVTCPECGATQEFEYDKKYLVLTFRVRK